MIVVPVMAGSLPQRAGDRQARNVTETPDHGSGVSSRCPGVTSRDRLVSVRCRERRRACRSASWSRRRRWRRSGGACHRAHGRGGRRRAAHRPTGARPSGRPGLRNGHSGPRRSATRSSGQLQWSHRPHFSNVFGIGLNVARGWEHSRNPPMRRVVRHLDPIMLTFPIAVESHARGLSWRSLHQHAWESLVLSVTGAARVRFNSAELGAESCPHRDVATVDPDSRPPRQRACAGARRVAGSLDVVDPDHRPTRPTAGTTQEQHDRRQHLQRSTPPRPRGAGGGPQAPGHVHRVHRHPRPHALPVGDHRQRRGRGAGRRLRPDRGHPPPRRLGRGARPRARHPGRQGAQDRARRRRGGLHQAARRRQVRRLVVRRDRWPARRRRLGGQRAVGAARRRRRPDPLPAGHELPPRRAGRLRRRRPGRAVPGEVGADPQGRPGHEGADRHPDPLLARPPDLHQGRHLRARGAPRPGSADVVHRPGARAGDPRPARRHPGRGEVPPRRRHRGVHRVPLPRRAGHRASCGCRAPTRSPRRCRCSTTRVT